MILLAASDLVSLVKDYNPVVVICILITFYCAVRWAHKQYVEVNKWYTNQKVTYHEQENKKEEKENAIENRFEAIEEKLTEDSEKLEKTEEHVKEIYENQKEFSKKFDMLSDMLIDLRLEAMRGRILDFCPLALDMAVLQSKERYNEIFKLHEDYVNLIALTGKTNNYEATSFKLIEKSFQERSLNKLFIEDVHITAADIDETKEKEDVETE